MNHGTDHLRHVFDQFRDYDRQRTATLLQKQRRRAVGPSAAQDGAEQTPGAPAAARPTRGA